MPEKQPQKEKKENNIKPNERGYQNFNTSKLNQDPKSPVLPSSGKQGMGYNPNSGNKALKKGATEVAKKIPGVGLLAHTPIGKKAIEKTVDAATNAVNQGSQAQEEGSSASSSPLSLLGKKKNPLQKLLGSNEQKEGKAENEGGIGEFFLKVKKYWPIAAVLGVLGGLLVLMILIINVYKLSPLFAMAEKMKTFFDDAGQHWGNLFTGCGWTSDVECNNNTRNDFFDEIQETYNLYFEKYGVRLNTSLLTATLTYTDIDMNDFDSSFDIEDFEDSGFDAGDYRNMQNNIGTLAKHMAPEKKIEETDENGKVIIVKTRKLDLDAYKEYLKTEFIQKMYLQGYSGNMEAKINEIIDDIYSRVDFFESWLNGNSSEFTGVYGSCQQVTIEGGDFSGTYSLEDYVAGVVQAEGSILGDEAQKALAIAARGYVINLTDNCKNPIGNSSQQQNFTTPTNSRVIANVAQTAGLVLTINGEIFSSEYDSFFTKTEKDENGAGGFYCDDTYCYANYYKKGAGWNKSDWQVHQVKILKEYGYIGGHGRGMSQWGAHYLDTVQGYKYEDILKYFYDDSATIGFLSGNGEDVTCGADVSSPNNTLLMKVEKAGWCTRQAVVEAATFLTYDYYHVPYFWGGKYINGGLNPNWGCPRKIGSSGASHQPYGSSFPLGLDCSGFVSWAVTNGGYYFATNYGQDELYTYRGASKEIKFKSSEFSYDNIQAGDLITMTGHIGMVISVNKANRTFVVGHSAGSTGMTTTVLDSKGRFVSGKNSGFTGIVYMDGFYNSVSVSNPTSGDVTCKKWGS